MLLGVLFFVVLTSPAGAQHSFAKGGKTYTYVEQIPQFPGELSAYLSDHFKYPDEAVTDGADGRVVVHFTVCKDGSLADVHTGNAGHPGLNREAIRVVRSMPAWKPALDHGVPVDCPYTLPVTLDPD